MMQYASGPIAGMGIGLRHLHFPDIFATNDHSISWYELLGDNYLDGGVALDRALRLREQFPMTIHTVGLSIGGTDALDTAYLDKLAWLCEKIQPAWLSDHLCWTNLKGQHFHDLLPLPQTEATAQYVAERISTIKRVLNCDFLLENVSSYLAYRCSDLSEHDFYSRVAEIADCGMLLDVNNVFVSASNHGFCPYAYLDAIPQHRVKQFHLAGYKNMGNYLIDTHGEAVHPPVWSLYEYALRRFGNIPTLIEWDTDIPSYGTLLDEANKAHAIMARLA